MLSTGSENHGQVPQTAEQRRTLDELYGYVIHKDAKSAEFRNKLRDLINTHNIDNDLNTPDYILGALLWDCLQTFDKATKKAHWHSTTPVRNDG